MTLAFLANFDYASFMTGVGVGLGVFFSSVAILRRWDASRVVSERQAAVTRRFDKGRAVR